MGSLPDVEGWVIDFRTARSILQSRSNYERSHLIELCESRTVWISHAEQNLFKSHDEMKKHFISDQNLVIDPNDDVIEAALTLDKKKLPAGRKLLRSDESSVFIAAAATAKGLGVISDHSSSTFGTVHDLCKVVGVPCYTTYGYFAAEK